MPGTINFTYTATAPSTLGIYWIDYSLINSTGDYIQTTYEAERFAVSLYEANPDGFVYEEKDKYQNAKSNEGEC